VFILPDEYDYADKTHLPVAEKANNRVGMN